MAAYILLLVGCLTLFEGDQILREKMDKLAPHASGLALVEVVDLKKVDRRGADGGIQLEVLFKTIEKSGQTNEKIIIGIEYGGILAPDKPREIPKGPVNVDTFKKGERYWIAFCSRYHFQHRYHEEIVKLWPESKAPEFLSEVVKEDLYSHSPQYHSKSTLTYSHRVDNDKSGWWVRVEKDGKLLWETKLPGEKKENPTADWFIAEYQQGARDFEKIDKTASGYYLFAETTCTLEAGNSFDFREGPCNMTYAFDAETGKVAAIWVTSTDFNPRATPLAAKYFDLKTGSAR